MTKRSEGNRTISVPSLSIGYSMASFKKNALKTCQATAACLLAAALAGIFGMKSNFDVHTRQGSIAVTSSNPHEVVMVADSKAGQDNHACKLSLLKGDVGFSYTGFLSLRADNNFRGIHIFIDPHEMARNLAGSKQIRPTESSVKELASAWGEKVSTELNSAIEKGMPLRPAGPSLIQGTFASLDASGQAVVVTVDLNVINGPQMKIMPEVKGSAVRVEHSLILSGTGGDIARQIISRSIYLTPEEEQFLKWFEPTPAVGENLVRGATEIGELVITRAGPSGEVAGPLDILYFGPNGPPKWLRRKPECHD
jgi:hypothetical protein